ncbi:MAG: hypothetical protein ABII24_00005, partial [bacterium]
MSQTYVQLTERAIFKSRYYKWYLIDTSRRERERILIEGGAERVLLFLFEGNTIEVACARFGLGRDDLEEFLRNLQNENVIAM